MLSPRSSLLWLILAAALCAVRSAPAGDASARPAPRELWYTLLLRDQPCGWVRSVEDTVDGNLRSLTETHMRLDRAGQSVTIELSSAFVETPEGAPVRLVVRTATGGPPVESEWIFPAKPTPGAEVKSIVRQGSSVREASEPYPAGPWLPPLAAERFFAERRAAGAKEIVYETIDGQSGLKPARTTSTFVDAGETTVDGRSVPTTRWRIASSLVPVDTTLTLSSDGEIVASATMLGSERLETRLSSKAEATRQVGGGPELMIATMVQADRPIPRSFATRTATYRVSVPDGTLIELPSAGAQCFERVDPTTGTLRVLVDAPLPVVVEPAERAVLLAPSSMIDSDDEGVRRLAAEALRGHEKESTVQRAERLRRAVHAHVREKGLETAFASAGETARARAGDCSEHAVLLAAMLRAAEIPSRVAVGLIYADAFANKREVFAWHMWTQALVPLDELLVRPGAAGGEGDHGAKEAAGGEAPLAWLDLDATLPGSTRYHAAHILTGVTDLAAGPMDPSLAQIVPLLGRLRIKVEQVD